MSRFTRSFVTLTWLAVALVGPDRLLAQSPNPLDPSSQPPAENPLSPDSPGMPAAPTAGQGGQFTTEQLGTALDRYGKNATTVNGVTNYGITVQRGKWNINVLVSLSPNKSVIWMTNDCTALPPPGQLEARALIRVLQKNTEIGPMFFSIAGGSLRLSYPLPNFDMTPAKLQDRVDAMVTAVVNTETLWSIDSLTGKGLPASNGQ